MKRKPNIIEIGFKILGALGLFNSIMIISTQSYVPPTAYGILGLMISIVCFFIKHPMHEEINTNYKSQNLYVGNLDSTYQSDNEEDDYQLMCKDGKVNYIFEKRDNDYYEIFTNQLIHTEESCHHDGCHCADIGELYLVNIKPIKDVVPKIKEELSKECMLYLFDSIN